MKKILAILTAFMLLLPLAGCIAAPEMPTEAPTEAPTQAPTEAPTEAPTQAPTEPPATVDYGSFIGKWKSTEHFHYMTLTVENGIMYLDYECASGNGMRIAMTSVSLALSDIQDGIAVFHYDNDGWNNQGTITLDFSQPGQITGVTETTYKDSSSQWSILPGTHIFMPDNR